MTHQFADTIKKISGLGNLSPALLGLTAMAKHMQVLLRSWAK
jgi:hypothetical protein